MNFCWHVINVLILTALKNIFLSSDEYIIQWKKKFDSCKTTKINVVTEDDKRLKQVEILLSKSL